jgi:sugar lactone lactonase YvrE
MLIHITAAIFLGMVSPCVGQQAQLSWPAAPEKARLQYIGSLTGSGDVESERGFLRKIWDAIVGAGEEAYGMVQPVGVAIDTAGRVFVTDPGARCIHRFDVRGEDYERITGDAMERPFYPVGICIDGAGRMYVADAEQNVVHVFDSDGDFEDVIDAQFGRPTGIACYGEELYVVDTGKHQVTVFSSAGKKLRQFGTRGTAKGEFNFPVGCAADGRLHIVDAMNFRVQSFNDDGSWVHGFGEQGNTQGHFAAPKGIAIDSDHHLYVTDALFDAFQIFDEEGRLLLVVGESGSGPGQFLNPAGICIDANDRVYVVDTLNRRVQIFQYFGGEQ